VWMMCECGAGLSRLVVKQREPRGHPLALARPVLRESRGNQTG
jgi:hypothetical protein